VLFLIGFPITSRLEKIRIGKRRLNDGIASTLTLLLFLFVFYLFFVLIFPPLAEQISFLSRLNFYDVLNGVLNEYPSLKSLSTRIGTESEFKSALSQQFNRIFDFGTVSLVVNNIFYYLSAFIGGLFCVLFITFFLLKDESTVSRTILLLTPQKHEGEVKDILWTSKKMLSKYFTGLLIDILIVGVITGGSLWLFGIKNALIIGFMAGLFNLIPYVGPLITLCFALFLGISGCIETGMYSMISPIATKITVTLLSVNLLDSLIIQPYIFSNTVRAHPLEIFLVVLIAGTLGGITGMVVAIPVYTLIRIVAKEFLSHYKFFRKISEKISE
jgi:predicted PurR-regulated permease PerM